MLTRFFHLNHPVGDGIPTAAWTCKNANEGGKYYYAAKIYDRQGFLNWLKNKLDEPKTKKLQDDIENSIKGAMVC